MIIPNIQEYYQLEFYPNGRDTYTLCQDDKYIFYLHNKNEKNQIK